MHKVSLHYRVQSATIAQHTPFAAEIIFRTLDQGFLSDFSVGHPRLNRRPTTPSKERSPSNSSTGNIPLARGNLSNANKSWLDAKARFNRVKQAQGREKFQLSCVCSTNFTVWTGCLRLLYTCEPGLTSPQFTIYIFSLLSRKSLSQTRKWQSRHNRRR